MDKRAFRAENQQGESLQCRATRGSGGRGSDEGNKSKFGGQLVARFNSFNFELDVKETEPTDYQAATLYSFRWQDYKPSFMAWCHDATVIQQILFLAIWAQTYHKVEWESHYGIMYFYEVDCVNFVQVFK
jgi:hypothetical protein